MSDKIFLSSRELIITLFTQGLIRNNTIKIKDNRRFRFAIKPKLLTQDQQLSCIQGFDPKTSHFMCNYKHNRKTAGKFPLKIERYIDLLYARANVYA